ncbi:hypothetical protein AHAS_Ahas07G0136500 [Arachis hypogaea]
MTARVTSRPPNSVILMLREPRVRKQNQNRRKCAACKLLGHTKRTCPVCSTKNKVTEYKVTGSNEEVGQPSHSSHPHRMHDLNFGTIDESRVEEAELGSYGLGLREGTVGGLDVEDAKTSKLMDMVASLAKAL